MGTPRTSHRPPHRPVSHAQTGIIRGERHTYAPGQTRSKKVGPKLKIGDLQRGDVLLSLGTGWLSDAIHFLDGGRYSHAGFFDGTKVVEAGKAGIVYNDVANDLKVQKYIHVYRYRGDNGEHLGTPGFPVDPLIDVATRYRKAGAEFAYQQLFLLAVLAITRQAPVPVFLKKLLRTVLDEAVRAVNDVLQNGKEPVICSELVYRIFYEPPPKNLYGLSIAGVLQKKDKFVNLVEMPAASLTRMTAAEEDDDAAKFDELALTFAQNYARAKAATGKLKLANPLVVADFVTPGDLETSVNLEEIGPLSL